MSDKMTEKLCALLQVPRNAKRANLRLHHARFPEMNIVTEVFGDQGINEGEMAGAIEMIEDYILVPKTADASLAAQGEMLKDWIGQRSSATKDAKEIESALSGTLLEIVQRYTAGLRNQMAWHKDHEGQLNLARTRVQELEEALATKGTTQ